MGKHRAAVTRLRRSVLAQSLTVFVLPAIIAGIASIAVGLLVNASADTLLLVAVVIFAVTAVTLVPIVVAPAQILSDFLRIASIDAGLLSGIAWHPDLTLSRVEIPDTFREGQTGQTIRVDLLYKPLLSSQRGPIDGSVLLVFDPPLLEVASSSFELSPQDQIVHLSFPVPESPFNAGVLAAHFDWDDVRRPNIKCDIKLRITSRWDLRLFDDPSDREVCIDVGSTQAEPIGIAEWTRRLIANQYLCVIPNDQNFNPVVPSLSDRFLGTNLAIDSHRWMQALDEKDLNAELLLTVAARMLSTELQTLQPAEFVSEQSAEAGAGDNLAAHLSKDINPTSLIERLRDSCIKCTDAR